MVGEDSGSIQTDSQPVVWLGMRVSGYLAPSYIHQMNRVKTLTMALT